MHEREDKLTWSKEALASISINTIDSSIHLVVIQYSIVDLDSYSFIHSHTYHIIGMIMPCTSMCE
jgi:hypothetical protein